MNRTSKSFAFAMMLGVSASAFANTAFAQVEGESVEEAKKFETIVVTAQRREQNLQDVPLSVTAVSGDALVKQGVADLTEVSKLSPNVNLEVSRGTNSTLTAFIRGVGQQDPVAGFESGIGIYLNDVYLNRPQGAVLDVFDVERIEVLRGPQGTLYGRNTIGGAVKYVTKKLSSEPEFEAKANIGTYGQAEMIAKVSAPVTETFRIGAGIASLGRDGFGKNLVSGAQNYDKDVMAARVSAEWDATDSLFFSLSGDYTKDKSQARQGHRLIPGFLTGAPVLPDVFDTRAGLNIVEQEVEAMGGSLVAEFVINDNWTIKNVAAYREDQSTTPIDFDSLQSGDFDVPAIYENDQISDELQLIYSSDRLNGIIGAYYLDANASTVFDVLLDTLSPGFSAQTFGDVGTKTWSLFGDFTYDFSEQLALTVGGRYTHDERHSIVLRNSQLGGFSSFFGGSGFSFAKTSDFNGSNEWDKFTPRVSLSYKPVDDHTLYATYAQGFKGGGFDPRGQTTAAPDLNRDSTVSDAEIFEYMAFDPEEVTSYELGWKGSFGGGRVNTNIAAFLMDYKDVQIPGSIGVDTNADGVQDSFVGITTNAGKANISGAEFEMVAHLGEDIFTTGDAFTTTLTAGYIDAAYDEFIGAGGVDVSGSRVFQNTPDWSASGVFGYSSPLGGGIMDAFLTASYKGDSSQFEVANSYLDQDAFTLVDFSLSWTAPDEHWTIGLHGKNLTDELYKVAGYTFVSYDANGVVSGAGLGREGVLTAFYGNPRTVTMSVGYKY